jgi:hypothetical protein
MAQQRIILTNAEPNMNASGEELADIIIHRLGLMPRKKGSTEKMNKVLVELYERSKQSAQTRDPAKSIMTVEEMAYFAGITRQTMYEYLKRWIELDLLTKVSFVDSNHQVVIGYRLNGYTLEQAFEKARARINNHLDLSQKYIRELQRILKNEKISQAQKGKADTKQE